MSDRLGLDLSRGVVLFTQHSVTTEFDRARDQVRPALEAIAGLAADGIQVIVTYPNNDAGGQAIIEELEAFAARNLDNVQIHRSLGRHLYHGVLALAQDPSRRVVCAGNSSSGIKETPAFQCPTVNIGSRQDGRLRGGNVIDVGYDCSSIRQAIRSVPVRRRVSGALPRRRQSLLSRRCRSQDCRCAGDRCNRPASPAQTDDPSR